MISRHVRSTVRLMAAAALLLLFPAVKAEADAMKPFPRLTVTSAATSGAAAISALGSSFPGVAAFYGKTAVQLRQLLLRDRTLRIGKTGRLYRKSPPATPVAISRASASRAQANAPVAGKSVSPANMPWAGNTAAPLAQTFKLHSNPGADKTIYLNFVGETLTSASALVTDNELSSITVPPYSTDADPGFSDEELRTIQEIWQRVAEDYSPFAVDVTTEPVAQDRITRSGSTDLNYGTEVLFAPLLPEWNCICSGVGYQKSFFDVGDSFKPAVVFHQAGRIGAHLLADAASQQLGLAMNLDPDGIAGGEYGGQGDSPVNGWVPIMADQLTGRPLSQFSKGEYNGATNRQDDFKVITDLGLPLRPDEAGGTIATAKELPLQSTSGRSTLAFDGIITSATDTDVFYIRAGMGLLDVRVDPAAVGANADLVLTLRDPAGNVLQSSNPSQNLSAAVSRQITTPGLYYLEVSSTGEGDPAVTGYSSYGSVGAYALTGSFATPSNAQPSASFTVIADKPLTATFDASASGDDGQIKLYSWDFGDGTSLELPTPGPLQRAYAEPGIHTVTLKVTDDSGLSATISRDITILPDGAAPVASFTASTVRGPAPLAVTFDPGASTDDVGIVSYDWDFGDGTKQQTTSGTPVSKSYATPGSYTVILTVADGAGHKATKTLSITVDAVLKPPVAAFTASVTSGMAPLSVTFDPASSSDDGKITGYAWDFGDGTTKFEPTSVAVSKTYTTPGPFTVRLTVTDDSSLTATFTKVITVKADNPPVASFTASTIKGQAPLAVTFDPRDSTDDVGIASYDWDFGDGTTQQTTSGTPVSKSYATPGSYPVTLTVADGAGHTARQSLSITVDAVPKPPVAAFTASVSSGIAPLSVTFDPASSSDDGKITGYAWDFGDGTTKSEPTNVAVSRTYITSGTFTVRLTVTDNSGLTSSKSVTVSVFPRPVPPVAAFTATPGGSTAPLKVSFDAGASHDDVGITQYEWNFGDGTPPQVVTAANTQHVYQSAGTFTVNLTVRDGDGLSSSTTQQVTVRSAENLDVPRVASMEVKLGRLGRNKAFARGDILVVDAAGKPAKKAVVFATWSGPLQVALWGTTRSNGTASFVTPPLTQSGCYRLTVTAVKLGGVTYQPTSPQSADVCR